jgi:hypothetical protein
MPADVPYIVDLAKAKAEKNLLTILAAPGELGRPLILDDPQDRRHARRDRMPSTDAGRISFC